MRTTEKMEKEIFLEGMKMVQKKGAHLYLKEKFEFPDYYGCNLDALYDCLTDLCEDVMIRVVYSTQDQNAKESSLPGILGVLKDAALENEHIHLGLTEMKEQGGAVIQREGPDV